MGTQVAIRVLLLTPSTNQTTNQKCHYNINNDKVYLYITHQKQCANMFYTEHKNSQSCINT